MTKAALSAITAGRRSVHPVQDTACGEEGQAHVTHTAPILTLTNMKVMCTKHSTNLPRQEEQTMEQVSKASLH